jgi:prepilin signal peptidase PulO-like enzyme (type II secretory pathway)
LPDSLTLPMIAVGLLVQPWLAWTEMTSAVAGVIVGAGSAVVASSLWRFWRHEDGLGYGDAKMMAALGACLGWWGTLFVLLVASSAAVVVGGVWMIRSRWKGTATAQASVPFGAYLALGAVLYVLVWLPADGR